MDILSKKFYYQMGIGYNFSAGVGLFENHLEQKDGSYSSDRFNGSWGKGFDLSLGFGTKVNRNLGLEMELGYVVGGSNKEENQYYITNTPYPYTDKQQAAYKANTFRINPKIVFEIPFEGVNAFYGKIGYMVGFGKAKLISQEDILFDTGQKGKGSYEWSYTGGIVSGSTMALGLRFNVEEDLSFFMEVTGNNLHRSFKKRTMTEASDNGQNTLPMRTVYSKETVYVDKVTYTTGMPDPNQPYEAAAFRSNFSSAGFRIGIVKHF